MTYPPAGGTPDPYQPQQPYGQPYDPNAPYSQDPYAPSSGSPASGAPSSGQPYPPQYGDVGKGQPYGQQYAGQPYGGQQYPPYAPVATTNTMAILALVFAFIFAPAAIVLGHIAKRQIRQTGEQGEGLATAGLWLGYIFTGLYVAFCALWIILAVAGIWGSGTTY
ncbi:MAG TPA: DUF4190 domain-containing protein [Actinoplanes sp.]|nr:DUF4190 domain-containing protein [Actinoplanes sp.]